MCSNTIDEVVQAIGSMSPLPAAAQRLSQMAEAPDTTIEEMAQVIETDSALTMRILRLVNSAFFGLSGRIDTVSRAIVVLGIHGVRDLALGLSVFHGRSGAGRGSPLSHDDLWRHSLATATLSRSLAKHHGKCDVENAFVTGLLHDMGKLIFMDFFPKRYADVLRLAACDQGQLVKLEHEAFGLGHAEVGGLLCEHWKLSTKVARLVAGHHQTINPQMPNADLLRTVQAADNLVKMARIGFSGDSRVDLNCLRWLIEQGFGMKLLRKTIQTLRDEVHEVETWLGAEPMSPLLTHHEESRPLVGVLLEDSALCQVVEFALSSAGLTPLGPTECDLRREDIVGVICDPSRWEEMTHQFSLQNIQVVALTDEAGVCDDDYVDVKRLRGWLRECRLIQSAGVPQ